MMKTCNTIVILLSLLLIACEQQGQQKENDGKPVTPLPEYSEANAREWEDKKEEHIPQVSSYTSKNKDFIVIKVPLQKANIGHYIEKIGVMTADGEVLATKTLPRVRLPVLSVDFDYNKIRFSTKSTSLKAFAKCNLHDLWVAPIKI